MAIINPEFNQNLRQTPSTGDAGDDIEWLDWDRWHAIEEYQDLLDGLSNFGEDGDYGGPKAFKDGDCDGNLARQFHRQGLEIDG